jgi:serine protease Do
MNVQRRILPVLALLFLSGLAVAAAPEASVVRIRAVAADGEVKWGSAVVVGANHLATTCHVTRRATTIEVLHADQRWLAQAQAGSVVHDLCMLTVEGLRLPAVAMRASHELMPGERVMALGFEHGSAALATASGAVKALYPYDEGLVIRTSAEFDFGSSGGGLFDQAGRLVGLLAFKARNGSDLRFVLPSEWLAAESTVAAQFESIDPASPAVAFWEHAATDRPAFLGAALQESRESAQ